MRGRHGHLALSSVCNRGREGGTRGPRWAVTVGALATALTVLAPAGGAVAAAALQFTDINPDDSGPLPGCPAPCPSGGSGGRVHHLASSSSHPNEVYAASELGGLFKSVNGGIKWFHLDGHLPTKAWDVAVDPGGELVYATSFYDGRVNSVAGIEVSPDGGLTWTHPPTATPPLLFCAEPRRSQPSGFGITIRPGMSNEVLAGTNCGLARSTTFGATWEFINPASGGGEALSVWDVVALPGGLTYACGEAGVMRSADGKAGWQTLPDPVPGIDHRYCSMAVNSAFPQIVFVVFSKSTYFDPIFDIRDSTYFASFDGGQHWTAMPHPDGTNQKRVPMVATNRRSYGLDVWVGAGNLFRIPCLLLGIVQVCPVTDSLAWAGSYTDGQSDNQKAHGDSGDLLFAPSGSVDACPVLYSSDGGVYVNFNLFECHDPLFLSANAGLHAQLLLGMAGVDLPGSQAEAIYMALQDNGLFGTSNAGASKPAWAHGLGADTFDVAADAAQVVVNNGANPPANRILLRGDPGPSNLVPVPHTPPPANQFLTTFTDVLDQWGPSSYVLATTGPDVLYTTNLTKQSVANGTVGWTSLGWPADAGLPCGVRAARGRLFVHVYVMSGDCIWRNQNQLWAITPGVTPWQRLDVNTPSECPGGFGIFAVDAGRPGRLYASCTGIDPPIMVRSTDGGNTWESDQALTALMTGPGVFVPKFDSPDDGATFGGVQPVMVAFDRLDANLLLAGGYESGVFVSSDGGKGWALLTDPFTPELTGVPHLPRPFYAYFDHEGGGPVRAFYVGSVGRGVWRITPAHTNLRLTLAVERIPCPRPGCLPGPCLHCPVSFGEELRYVIHARNLGGGLAGNLILRHSLPEGFAIGSIQTPRRWDCTGPGRRAGGEVRCTARSLAPGEDAMLTIRGVVEVHEGSVLRAEASIVSNALDRDPDDNRAAAANPVVTPPRVGR